MTKSRFIRMRLEATALQRIDPAGLVGDWLEDLRDLFEGVQADEPQQEAYSLLAMHGRLRRVRPDLLSADQGGLLAQLEQRLNAGHDDLIADAVCVPNPLSWLNLSQLLADSYDDFIDPAEQSRAAWRLVQDWDDAAIVRATAGERWRQEPGLEAEWQQANDWLLSHPDVFLAASYFVQTIAATFRDDLETYAPDLAPTTKVYASLLDAFEAFEVESRYEHLIPLSAEQIKACLPEQPTVAASRAGKWLQPHAPALAAQESRFRQSIAYTWQSPDGQYLAMLAVPLDLALIPASILTVTLHHNDDSLTSAADLAGKQASLDGVLSTIDAQGKVTFDALRVYDRCGSSPVLQAGDPLIAWPRSEQ